MSEPRNCPVAPDGRELPWHVHDDWYAARLAELELERDGLRELLDEAFNQPLTQPSRMPNEWMERVVAALTPADMKEP